MLFTGVNSIGAISLCWVALNVPLRIFSAFVVIISIFNVQFQWGLGVKLPNHYQKKNEHVEIAERAFKNAALLAGKLMLTPDGRLKAEIGIIPRLDVTNEGALINYFKGYSAPELRGLIVVLEKIAFLSELG